MDPQSADLEVGPRKQRMAALDAVMALGKYLEEQAVSELRTGYLKLEHVLEHGVDELDDDTLEAVSNLLRLGKLLNDVKKVHVRVLGEDVD